MSRMVPIAGNVNRSTSRSVHTARCRGGSSANAASIAALVLMVGSFVVMAQFGGAPPGSAYTPAHIEDGRFVPGTTQ